MAFKFLWAPLVDVFGRRRALWVASCQAVMGASLFALPWFGFADGFGWIALLLGVHAMAAATQDVAIDAWAIAVTPESERGRLNAAMQYGMLSGRWLFGAGLLLAGVWIPFQNAAAALAGVIWLVGLFVLFVGRRSSPAPRSAVAASFLPILRRALGSRIFWTGAAVALTAGAAFEALGAVAGPFLIDRGFSQAQTGAFFSGTVVLMLGGAAVGGHAADRYGARRAVLGALLVVAALVAAVGLLDGVSAQARTMAMAAVYLGIGVLTASSYTLFMNLTDPRLGGTQFSAYMAATNACEAWAAFTVGRLVGAFGYPHAFVTMAAVSLAALAPLRALRSEEGQRRAGPKNAQ